MIVELNLDKETTFMLEMEIEGDTGEQAEMRFCLEFDAYTMALKAKKVGNGMYEITCPKLKGIVEAGSYGANVEVYIGDKRFVPLQETVLVKQEIKPVVKLSENKAPPSQPSVSIKSIRPTIQKTGDKITK